VSNNPKPITVNILGEEYMIACGPGEEDALRNSAALLDSRMKEIRTSGKVMSNERIAVMAALNLSHEVLALRDKVSTDGDQIARRIKSLRDKVELALNDTNQLEL
jgi:cell division protein ZapA